MQKAKKMSKQTLVIAVLAVLLVLSLALTVTGAWFTDTAADSSQTTITFATVDVNNNMVKDEQGNAFSHTRIDGQTEADLLLPGDKVALQGSIDNGNSTVDIYIAVKIAEVTVLGKTAAGNYDIDLTDILGTLISGASVALESPLPTGYTDTTVACTDGSKIYLVGKDAAEIDYAGTIVFSDQIGNQAGSYYLNAGATGATADNTIVSVQISARVEVYAIQADNMAGDTAVAKATSAKTALETSFTTLATAPNA